MRIGLFGGTFDPPHLGHLILAERCRDEAELDAVWFLPAYQPPHKADDPITRFEQRCEMVSLAITGQAAFRVEPLEKDLPTPSYTAETVAELRRRHPNEEFHLILGGDSVTDLPSWYHPERILDAVALIGVPRPGVEPLSRQRLAETLQRPVESIRLQWIPCPLIEISSRAIRERVCRGRSIRYLVPRAVEEYIRERRLYRAEERTVETVNPIASDSE
jgi:nicotinate-nucleotide adenylyltransferase